ncbi:hypothetical protein SI65_05364 [Aspergillus cristatus]|uniref:Uncharacterized protein n=1 Tax=Aspergillus cristatus TaxID=573508 RepID=A0A1E3BCS7_ASPCR|nr:hypothetical protein SI65_05364 [Aspergillus cristatus]
MPLAAHYIGWAFNNLAKETKKDPLQSYEPLSRTEETRLVRALYRFQLYCNLFGVSHYRFRCQWMLEFDHVNILRIYLGNYEPWEVEEIACIYAFTKATFNQVFDDIRWDVHQDNPRFEEHRPPTPQGAFNLDSGCGARLHPTDQDSKQKRRDPLPFQGDNEELPPLAWTLIWQGTYSNLFGWYIKDELRSWGYIMWDAARLERTGAKEVLHRQWKACWEDVDPRNRLRYAN